MDDIWKDDGLQLLDSIAANAMRSSGSRETASKVMNEAIKVTKKISTFPNCGTKFTNQAGDDRYYTTFWNGCVVVWLIDNDGPLILGAWRSLPQPFKS